MTDDELAPWSPRCPTATAGCASRAATRFKACPTALAAEAAGTGLATLDAWVIGQRGQLRTARVPSATAQRPGHRTPRPPPGPQRFYVVPSTR